MENRSRFQNIVIQASAALIGGALLVACVPPFSNSAAPKASPAVKKTESAMLPSNSPQPSPSQVSPTDKVSALEKIPLKKGFLEKLKQVPNQQDREQYIGAIYELNRLSKKDPKNKAIFEMLVQNQEKLLPILQLCGYKYGDGSSSFRWNALNGSNFWELSSQK